VLRTVEFDNQARVVASRSTHAAESVKWDGSPAFNRKRPAVGQCLKAAVQEGLGCATRALHTLRIRRERACRINKQHRQRRFGAVPDKPAHTGRVVALPRRVGR
jgi:hypothetical protein